MSRDFCCCFSIKSEPSIAGNEMPAAESPDFPRCFYWGWSWGCEAAGAGCKATAADGGDLLGVAHGWGLRVGIDRNFGL